MEPAASTIRTGRSSGNIERLLNRRNPARPRNFPGPPLIDVALFGAGRIGTIHAGNLAREAGARLKYVVDPNAKAAQSLAGRHEATAADMVELRLDGVEDLDVPQALHGRTRPSINAWSRCRCLGGSGPISSISCPVGRQKSGLGC